MYQDSTRIEANPDVGQDPQTDFFKVEKKTIWKRMGEVLEDKNLFKLQGLDKERGKERKQVGISWCDIKYKALTLIYTKSEACGNKVWSIMKLSKKS